MANESATKPTYSELEAELLRVRGLLQRLEWTGSHDGDHCCPICREYSKPGIHEPDCELRIILLPPSISPARCKLLDGSTRICELGTFACSVIHDMSIDDQFKGMATDEKYQAVTKALLGSAEAQRQWISVEERLPEDDDTSVWVCFENGSHYCSARFIEEEWWGYNLETEDTFQIEQKITHWMPLHKLTTVRPSSSLVPSGAESADIGKLDTADKSGASPELLPTQLEKEREKQNDG